MLFVLS